MELLADIPKDEGIEDIAFEGLPISGLTSGPVLSAVDSILERIGGKK